MAVAFTALVVALGGTSYAVVRLPSNSVGSKHLKKGAVRNADIKSNAITGAKIKNGSLRAADLNLASLSVPSAADSTHAGAAAGLDKIYYRAVSSAVGPAAVDPADPANTISAVNSATAGCDPGQLVEGGGARVENAEHQAVVDSYPDGGGRSWTAHVDNGDASSAHGFSVFAICVPASSPG
jgi:hypothetical protein